MKISKSLIVFIVAFSMILCSCSQVSTGDGKETGPTDTTAPQNVFEPSHEITVSDVTSILAENGLRTNINKWTTEACAYHGGQQMRVCHTERGTYAAFLRDYGDGDGIEKFYVAKIDNEGNVSVLYYGGIYGDDGTATVNIGQDTNGDIIVTATSHITLAAYIFDAETDEMTKYSKETNFSSGKTPGYGQIMFDFENRKIYNFTVSGSGTTVESVGDYLIEWFCFDMETKEWDEASTYVWLEGIDRHGYMYPFPDGNGGAYVVAQRNEYAECTNGRFSMALAERTYVWDRIELFHIPDLTIGANVTYTTVQLEDDSLGLEGVWSSTPYNQNGDVFVDSNGYMHIIYLHYLADYTGTHEPYDNKAEYRHAVYNGMELVFNEKLSLPEEKDLYYRPMIRQKTDGTLCLIVAKLWDFGNGVEFNFYSTGDELGREWSLEKTITVNEGSTAHSLNLSAVRDGSVQDNVLSCFYYGNSDSSNGRRGFTFNISLDDFSATEVIDILDGYPTGIDDVRYDNKNPVSTHQTQIVRTENATYAAFVYNYDHNEETEQFYIVKIDADGKATVLESGSYGSTQNKYISIKEMPDGMIYVSLPTGNTLYVIDPATDDIRLCETGSHTNIFNQIAEMDYFFGDEGEDGYILTVNYDFSVMGYGFDTENISMKIKGLKKYSLERDIEGNYSKIRMLSDGNGGVYMVGTREIWQSGLSGKLEYENIDTALYDSLMLFYIPDLSDGKVINCAEISVPYETEGSDGIWSVVDIAKNGDVYLDSDGNLHILYSYYHYDYDFEDAGKNAELIANTLEYRHAIYKGTELISEERIEIDTLTNNSSVRVIETADGTQYLAVCKLGEESASVDIYEKTDDGYSLALKKSLGEFAAEGFCISGITDDGSISCLVYASNNDVYYTEISFK